MFTTLSWLGRLAWPALSPLVPGINPRLLLVLLGFLAALVIVGGPAGAVWLHMHAAKREAVAARDTEWKLKLAEAEHAADLEISRQLQAATDAAAATQPITDADLDRLCANDKRCDEHPANQRQRRK